MSKSKILLAEDDETLAFVTADNLNAKGYEAVSYTHLDVYKRQFIVRAIKNLDIPFSRS